MTNGLRSYPSIYISDLILKTALDAQGNLARCRQSFQEREGRVTGIAVGHPCYPEVTD
jgi:hypothetical protein